MTRIRRVLLGCVCASALLAGAAAARLAQTTGPPRPSLIIASMSGRDLFEFYCASCHGRDGTGAGPVAANLKVTPPDLTGIAHRNHGTFPRRRLEAVLTNDGSGLASAHGTSEMPVWGPIFTGLDPSDTLVRVRISNLIQHIESIQAK